MFEHTFIGLDVHAVNVVGHALNPATGEITAHTMAVFGVLEDPGGDERDGGGGLVRC